MTDPCSPRRWLAPCWIWAVLTTAACTSAKPAADSSPGGTEAPADDGGGTDGTSSGGEDGSAEADGGSGAEGSGAEGSGEGSAGDGDTPTEHCTEVDAFVPIFTTTTARWATQDAAAPWPTGGLVVVGSSSIRRWEDLARTHTAHEVIQRGFGGAQLGEVAALTDTLVTRHTPAGVLVFAGTNDVAAGVDPAVVGDRLRCFVQRVHDGLGDTVPVVFIGITPTPARWSLHGASTAVNAIAQELAAELPSVAYADVPTAFLATGSPPAHTLFVDDGLHLSASGYALWDSVVTPVLDSALAPTARTGSWRAAPGTRVLIDLGASDATNGEPTASPDHLGQRWNNWHPLSGGAEVLPGERLAGLVTASGEATPLELIVTGGFFNNGREHGGLLWPAEEKLAGVAVGTATQDFFYSVTEDQSGGLAIRGLDPAGRYTLRLFASRATSELRHTRYTLHGAATEEVLLQTSGPGAGADDGNDDELATFPSVQPDAQGRLYLDLSPETGPYAYLSLIELTVAE